MQLSDAGLALICEFEGYHTRLPDGGCAAYLCPAGVVTIGFGCTEGVKIGDVWTLAQAEAALRRELAKHEAAVNRLVTVDITQGQRDALISFSYNLGTGTLAGSSLLKKLNKGDHAGACDEFIKFNKARVPNKKTGKRELAPVRGLTIRRAKEAALFASRDDVPMMPQKVEAAKEPVTATQAVAVTTTVGGTATALTQMPKPPTALIETAGMWKVFAGEVVAFGTFAVTNPKAIGVIGLTVAAYWFGPKVAPRLFGRE